MQQFTELVQLRFIGILNLNGNGFLVLARCSLNCLDEASPFPTFVTTTTTITITITNVSTNHHHHLCSPTSFFSQTIDDDSLGNFVSDVSAYVLSSPALMPTVFTVLARVADDDFDAIWVSGWFGVRCMSWESQISDGVEFCSLNGFVYLSLFSGLDRCLVLTHSHSPLSPPQAAVYNRCLCDSLRQAMESPPASAPDSAWDAATERKSSMCSYVAVFVCLHRICVHLSVCIRVCMHISLCMCVWVRITVSTPMCCAYMWLRTNTPVSSLQSQHEHHPSSPQV